MVVVEEVVLVLAADRHQVDEIAGCTAPLVLASVSTRAASCSLRGTPSSTGSRTEYTASCSSSLPDRQVNNPINSSHANLRTQLMFSK